MVIPEGEAGDCAHSCDGATDELLQRSGQDKTAPADCGRDILLWLLDTTSRFERGHLQSNAVEDLPGLKVPMWSLT